MGINNYKKGGYRIFREYDDLLYYEVVKGRKTKEKAKQIFSRFLTGAMDEGLISYVSAQKIIAASKLFDFGN